MTDLKIDIPKGTPVLVTGATGFTGSVMARKLAEAGLKVNAIARPSSKLDSLKGLDIRFFRGNVFDPATVSEACKGVEYIFHLAAAYREAKSSDDVYSRVHVESTKLLAQEAKKNPSFKRFVHVSTVGVHGHIENPPADENYPFNPGDVYQQTKADAEIWLRNFAAANALPYAVVRPCAIFGPGDRRLLKLFKMAAGGNLLILGRGKCLYHLIHVADLTNIIALSATSAGLLNDVVIAGNETPVSLTEMGRIIASHFGKQLRIIRLPAWPFFALGAVCELVCKPLGIEPPLYRRRVAFYTKDRAFNTEKLRQKLGYQYQYTNETGLQQAADWYKAKGWIR